MHLAQVTFVVEGGSGAEGEELLAAINNLLGCWREHGQALGCEYLLARAEGGVSVTLALPRAGALRQENDSRYAPPWRSRLNRLGVASVEVRDMGRVIESAEPCRCSTPKALALYIRNLLEPPLRCLDCWGPRPLYELPSLDGEELHHLILCWQSDYQACDRLQMNCSTGERFGLREMALPDSSLSKRGRAICDSIGSRTSLPTYYYLHRYRGRSRRQEEARLCPVCNGAWRLAEPLHERFDFRCDRCRLLSNIALSLP